MPKGHPLKRPPLLSVYLARVYPSATSEQSSYASCRHREQIGRSQCRSSRAQHRIRIIAFSSISRSRIKPPLASTEFDHLPILWPWGEGTRVCVCVLNVSTPVFHRCHCVKQVSKCASHVRSAPYTAQRCLGFALGAWASTLIRRSSALSNRY